MTEKENLKRLTEPELHKKNSNLKTTQKVLLALGVCITVFYFFQIGYAVGKDTATGILDMPNSGTFFLSLFAIIIANSSIGKKIKSVEQEMKERKN